MPGYYAFARARSSMGTSMLSTPACFSEPVEDVLMDRLVNVSRTALSKLPLDASRLKGLDSFQLASGFRRLPKMSETRCQHNVEPLIVAVLFYPSPGEFHRLLVVMSTQVRSSDKGEKY